MIFKYGLKISDDKFKLFQRKFRSWYLDYRECQYDEPNEDGYFETYDLIEDAYDDGSYDRIDEVCDDLAETAFFRGMKLAFSLMNVMETE